MHSRGKDWQFKFVTLDVNWKLEQDATRYIVNITKLKQSFQIGTLRRNNYQ